MDYWSHGARGISFYTKPLRKRTMISLFSNKRRQFHIFPHQRKKQRFSWYWHDRLADRRWLRKETTRLRLKHITTAGMDTSARTQTTSGSPLHFLPHRDVTRTEMVTTAHEDRNAKRRAHRKCFPIQSRFEACSRKLTPSDRHQSIPVHSAPKLCMSRSRVSLFFQY